MKRGWTRFLVSVSLALLLASTGSPQGRNVRKFSPGERDYEWKLAGLLPGHTLISRAEALLGPPVEKDPANRSALWIACGGHNLTVESDVKGIIQTVRILKPLPLGETRGGGCTNTSVSDSKLASGKGLRLGDPTDRVLQLYGKPDSRSPSTKGGQRLELLYYAFDWAGPDVPQVMEIVCTVGKSGEPGRVVEITLAASSL